VFVVMTVEEVAWVSGARPLFRRGPAHAFERGKPSAEQRLCATARDRSPGRQGGRYMGRYWFRAWCVGGSGLPATSVFMFSGCPVNTLMPSGLLPF